jgi:hypothetical protein
MIWRVRRAIVSVVAVAVVVLSVSDPGSASPARTGGAHTGVKVGIRGFGEVFLRKGFVQQPPDISCLHAYCPGSSWLPSKLRALVTANPDPGWKFENWRGACKEKPPNCAISLARVHPDAHGDRHGWLTAMFIPTVPGFTRKWPVPLGRTVTDKLDGFRFRVNSVTPAASLTPAPKAGSEYFVANITATYFGPASSIDLVALADYGLVAVGTGSSSHNRQYTAHRYGCPADGPKPQLSNLGPLDSAQSATGNVCWTIAANDASGLDMYFYGPDATYDTWFALH